MRRVPPLYPYLLVILPVASDYQVNIGEQYFEEFLAACLLMLLVAAVVVLLARLAVRSFRQAAVLAAIFLVGLLFYMRVFYFIEALPILGGMLGRHRYMMSLFVLMVAATAWWLRRTKRPLVNLTAVANVVAMGMVLLPLAKIGWYYGTHRVHRAHPEEALRAEPGLAGAHSVLPPRDIWYIILDRYPDRATLRQRFAFDNREFYDSLTARGFYVAQRSHSNYPATALSLASSLNFDYLDPLISDVGEDSDDWRHLYERIRRHKVGAFLRSQGYRYVHSGSWWWPTWANGDADENIIYFGAPVGVMSAFYHSILIPFTWRSPSPWLDMRVQQWYRLHYKFNRLAELPAEPGPKFVFVHLLAPHPPYALRADGSFPDAEEVESLPEEVSFRNEVSGLNRLILKLIDRIQADSAVPPVIILQADEGPYPPLPLSAVSGPQPIAVQRAFHRQKSGILNAYYLPGVPPTALYPDITPVNSFRLVFHHYFGAALPRLPDRVFALVTHDKPYRLRDVTTLVSGE